MKLENLQAAPYNPRKITARQLEMLQKSIEEFGDLSGFIFNETTGHLVSGHQRCKVLPKASEIIIDNRLSEPTEKGTIANGHVDIGSERFPIRIVQWSEAKEKAANIAANKHGGAFDMAILPELLLELDSLNIDMDLTGFDGDELEKIMAPDIAPVAGEDEAPSVPNQSKVVLGDIFILGNHRLMCGDSTSIDAVEKLMAGEKADMVFTDPPYGVSYEKKCNEIANQSKTRLKSTIENDDLGVDGLKEVLSAAFSNIDMILADKSCYYVCSPQGGELGLMMMMMMQEANLLCRHMIIWVKNAPVFSMNRLDYDYRHEPILFGWSKNRTHNKIMNGEFKNSVWEVSREPNKLHPTMKPVALPENALLNSCPKDGIVIDLFGGSGSTMIAAEKTGKRARLMELDPHYCSVILDRWEKFTGKQAFHENGTPWQEMKHG